MRQFSTDLSGLFCDLMSPVTLKYFLFNVNIVGDIFSRHPPRYLSICFPFYSLCCRSILPSCFPFPTKVHLYPFLLLPITRQEQCSGVRRKDVDAGMKRPGANLATITRSRTNLVSASGPASQQRQSLYDVVTAPGNTAEEEEDHLLGHNIYDATPDHSILKHGLAKSLSNFHLGESAPVSLLAKWPLQPSQHIWKDLEMKTLEWFRFFYFISVDIS